MSTSKKYIYHIRTFLSAQLREGWEDLGTAYFYIVQLIMSRLIQKYTMPQLYKRKSVYLCHISGC